MKEELHTIGLNKEAWRRLLAYKAKQPNKIVNSDLASNGLIYYIDMLEKK